MSEHSIKELTRQRDNAKSVLNSKKLELAAAEKRLYDARVAETGLVGKVAITDRNRFVVQSVEFLSDRPFWVRGFKIKKDGSPGFQEVGAFFNQCVFEPFVAKI